MESGPIIIYEEDKEERDLMDMAFKEMKTPNQILYFEDGEQMLRSLRTTEDKPFLIISEIRISKMDGLELKQKIEQDELLKQKSIPFIYLTITPRNEEIEKAYNLTVQGYFKKGTTLESIRDDLQMIIHYWGKCYHPNGTKKS